MARLTSIPAVGDGITLHGWSDSQAYTVVEVVNKRTFIAQRDNAVRSNRAEDHFSPGGFFGHTTPPPGGQQWDYTPDPAGRKIKITLRKDGTWRESYMATGKPVSEGRREYYDYNF